MKAPALYSGPLSREHRSDLDPVTAVVTQQAVDEAGRHGAVGACPRRWQTTAKRVKTSMAVSWYTLPTPLSLPM